MDINAQSDKEVEKLEKKLRAVYLRAQMDTQAKMEDYLRRFAIKDQIKREQVFLLRLPTKFLSQEY